ncbi:cysteine-rich RLK (RECEPTOR-like protein kinase) 8 [Abeliophyllum distichum]|uniref:Cysteine-rich RLK (RECEPTOR-like protein kinase) 8 n=1 Tax=Abeliophyllum distichum TaxID=126358 RepID=A0ABD1Q9I6_9LAMI
MVYKTNLDSNSKVDKNKERLVVKGYRQKFGVDYEEIFAPITHLETVRLLLSLAAQKGWKEHQMNVKSVFLNGFLEEELYFEQPPGFENKGKEHKAATSFSEAVSFCAEEVWEDKDKRKKLFFYAKKVGVGRLSESDPGCVLMKPHLPIYNSDLKRLMGQRANTACDSYSPLIYS